MPSWRADVRRAILCAVGVAVGCTLLLLLASTGLMRRRPGFGTVMVADGLWAGVLAGTGGVAWAFIQITTSRSDYGYRHRGLPGLLALAVGAATLINLAAMTLWRSSLAIIPAFLALIGVGRWQGATIFASPPSVTSLAVWTVIAAVGLVVLLLVARFTSETRPG